MWTTPTNLQFDQRLVSKNEHQTGNRLSRAMCKLKM